MHDVELLNVQYTFIFMFKHLPISIVNKYGHGIIYAYIGTFITDPKKRFLTYETS